MRPIAPSWYPTRSDLLPLHLVCGPLRRPGTLHLVCGPLRCPIVDHALKATENSYGRCPYPFPVATRLLTRFHHTPNPLLFLLCQQRLQLLSLHFTARTWR